MSRENRKKIITISILACVLIALVFVYIFVVLPLTEEEEAPPAAPPLTAPGEGLYNNTMVTVYPELDKTKIEYIEISNKDGTYAFHKYYDTSMQAEELRIKGHEKIDYDDSMLSILLAYIYLPVSYQSHTEANAPMRDVSLEKMKEYGVTEDTCQASYTVGYKENGEMKYHTVYIGEASFTDETTYFVSLKGRNSIYRFHQEGVESCMLVPLEEYLSPFIYGRYENVMIAMASIERFKIGLSNSVDNTIEDLVQIVKTGQNADGTTNMYDLYYKSKGTGKITRTGASADQLNKAFTAFYTYFSGDKVVSINPSDEELDKCGLNINDSCYFVTAQFSEDEKDMYTFQISQPIDGYYYTLSTVFGEGNEMLIRIPQASLSFLGSDGKAIFEWAGTDVSSLFYEYLKRDDKENQPGMYEVSIRVQKKEDITGNILYNISDKFIIGLDDDNKTVATQQSNGKQYATIDKVNQFVNFYTLLIRLPAPAQFNNMTEAEINALMADDSSIVFQLIARRNDEKVFQYTYYQIGTGIDIMVVTQEGHMDGGAIVFDEEPQISYNTTMSQIDILREQFQKLINGEEVVID